MTQPQQPAASAEDGYSPFFKPTDSEGETSCVEVAVAKKGALIRDTKDRTGGTLKFPGATYNELLRSVASL